MTEPGAKGRGVLFVCVENSARSQMAEGFLRQMAPHIKVQSAGTVPGSEVSPAAVKAMREVGIDIARQAPKSITPDMVAGRGTVTVSMGCMDSDACPALFAKGVTNWNIEDPKGRGMDEVRAIRDLIRGNVQELVCELEGALQGGKDERAAAEGRGGGRNPPESR